MVMLDTAAMTFDRKKLAMSAIKASIAARKTAGADSVDPVNVYDICQAHDVIVRFTDIGMEGMYDRAPRPRIHISSLRPLVRRNLTCAHELGHHVFGHGSTIDEMTDRAELGDHNDPDEFLANQFAYFLMMPALGIRNAFVRRKIDPRNADDRQMFRIACNFGVGYATLLTHLRYSLKLLPEGRFQELKRTTPKSLRSKILSDATEEPLILVDREWNSPTIDLETGDWLILPTKGAASTARLSYHGEIADGHLFQAARSGIDRIEIKEDGTGAFVRIAKRRRINGRIAGYIGLARYRHLEDDDDE